MKDVVLIMIVVVKIVKLKMLLGQDILFDDVHDIITNKKSKHVVFNSYSVSHIYCLFALVYKK
jgi:hypothetical protein